MMKKAILWIQLGIAAFVAPPVVGEEVLVIAVLEFENQTPDPKNDWMGGGLAETLTTQLSGLAEINVVERRLLHEVLKEIEFQRSKYVDRTTAQEIGRILGADSIVVGGYQVFEGQGMRLTARLVSVETGGIQAPVILDGSENEFNDLQIDLAEALSEKIIGTLADIDRENLRVSRPASKVAQKRLSDGIYFLRQDLLEDALSQFDAALALDTEYAEASYYKGLTLQKLELWDEAVQAFKRALPTAEPVRHIKWDWQVPWIGEKTRLRGHIWPRGMRRLKGEDTENRYVAPDRLIFTERVKGGTALAFVNLITKTTHRNLFPDPNLHLRQDVLESGGLVTLKAGKETKNARKAPVDRTLYVMDLESRSVLLPIKDLFCSWPHTVVAEDTLILYDSHRKLLMAFDIQSQEKLWEREGELSTFGGFQTSKSETQGWLMTAVSESDRQKRIVTIRVNDGAEIWSADTDSKNSRIFAQDHKIFDLGKQIAVYDLNSGAMLFDLDLRPDTSVTAALDREILVVPTMDRELVAVRVNGGLEKRERVLWRLQDSVHWLQVHEGQLFAGTQNGRLLIMAMETGQLSYSEELARGPLRIHHVEPSLAVASSKGTIFAIDPYQGQKLWEYQTNFGWPRPVVSQGVVGVRASRKSVTFLDAETGKPLWHHLGTRRVPSVYTTGDSIFVADGEHVMEFGVSRALGRGLSQKEVLTELGKTYLLQGNLEQAAWYLDKVTNELDPGYSEARLLRGQLLAKQGKRTAATRELLRHLALIPTTSRPFKERLDDLQAAYGLLWRTEESESFPQGLTLVGDRLITVGSTRDDNVILFAADVETGTIVWRHVAEQITVAGVDPEAGKLIYLSGRNDNYHYLSLWSADLRSGERTRLWETVLERFVFQAAFTISSGRLFLQICEVDVDEMRSWLRIVALDTITGNLLWQQEMKHKLALAKVFKVRGEYLAYSVDDELTVVRADNGQTVSRLASDSPIISQRFRDLAFDTNPRFHLINRSHRFMTVNPAHPYEVDRFQLTGFDRDFVLSPGLVFEDILYDSDSNRVFAIDLSPQTAVENRLLWELEINSQDAVTHFHFNQDRNLFVRGTDNVLRRVDPETGAVLSKTPLLWEPFGLHVAGNIVYASTGNGIYAMELNRDLQEQPLAQALEAPDQGLEALRR